MANMTTKKMWQTVKEYFGDGHVLGSAPLRYNLHICDMKRPPATVNGNSSLQKDNTLYGVEIGEQAMPLFSVFGDTSPPPCTCFDMAAIVQRIDSYLETAPATHPDDYTITSGKDDRTLDDLSLYTMRDVLSWWVQWGGVLQPSDHWKQIYVGFAATTDDVQLPPTAILDNNSNNSSNPGGVFRFLGHTWADCKRGLLLQQGEGGGMGMPPDAVEFLEMCLWRQLLTQYVEKVDPLLGPLLRGKTTLMTQFRVVTANALACAALMLAAHGVVLSGLKAVADGGLEAAAVAQCLGMDMAKEALGVLRGEKTEAVAGGDRALLKRELRWVYVRCMEALETRPNAHVLRRYASSGLHYVAVMDRYLERVRGTARFPITPAVAAIIEPFINRGVGSVPAASEEGGGMNRNVIICQAAEPVMG